MVRISVGRSTAAENPPLRRKLAAVGIMGSGAIITFNMAQCEPRTAAWRIMVKPCSVASTGPRDATLRFATLRFTVERLQVGKGRHDGVVSFEAKLR